MDPYNNEIVALLNECFSKSEQYVESVLLASYGFNIQFVNLTIICEDRVFATINGKSYVWDDAPSPHPWGALGRQLAKTAILESDTLLQIHFESGDLIKIETCIHHYESVTFVFHTEDGERVVKRF